MYYYNLLYTSKMNVCRHRLHSKLSPLCPEQASNLALDCSLLLLKLLIGTAFKDHHFELSAAWSIEWESTVEVNAETLCRSYVAEVSSLLTSCLSSSPAKADSLVAHLRRTILTSLLNQQSWEKSSEEQEEVNEVGPQI